MCRQPTYHQRTPLSAFLVRPVKSLASRREWLATVREVLAPPRVRLASQRFCLSANVHATAWTGCRCGFRRPAALARTRRSHRSRSRIPRAGAAETWRIDCCTGISSGTRSYPLHLQSGERQACTGPLSSARPDPGPPPLSDCHGCICEHIAK